MHFALLKIHPPGTPPSHSVDDVLLPLYFALHRLGFSVGLRVNAPHPSAINIVFGSCTSPRRTSRMLPKNSIIFNLEQFTRGSMWENNDYLSHLSQFAVWDYSQHNIRRLAELGVKRAAHVPLGYVPEMTRLAKNPEAQLDVLFYGLLNERRMSVLRALKENGLRVCAVQDAFGAQRDALIAQAKVVLNVHYYIPADLEVVRLSYLWANKKAVVCERHPESRYPEPFSRACLYASLEDLPAAVCKAVADASQRERLEESGFAAFSAHTLMQSLEGIIGKRAAPAVPAVMPQQWCVG